MSKFLNEVYKLDDDTNTAGFYDRYADEYDAAVDAGGYVTPRRMADHLAQLTDDKATPIFDFGCGTGLLGVELARLGFDRIDGGDVSSEMLAQARAKDVYGELLALTPGAPVPFSATYPIVTACGVISPAHAPPEAMDMLLDALPQGGLLALSLNDHALAAGFEGRVSEHVDCGAAELLIREHGAHMPAEDLHSTVYVLQKR